MLLPLPRPKTNIVLKRCREVTTIRENKYASKAIALGIVLICSCQTGEVRQTGPDLFRQSIGQSLVGAKADTLYADLKQMAQRLKIVAPLDSMPGYLQCFQDGQIKSCYLRYRSEHSPYVQGKKKMTRSFSRDLVADFLELRPGLVSERQILAQIDCSRISEQLPPYSGSHSRCAIGLPLATNESNLAKRLADKIYARVGVQNPKQIVAKLTCDESKTPPCAWHAIGDPQTASTLNAKAAGMEPLGAVTQLQLIKLMDRTAKQEFYFSSEGSNKAFKRKTTFEAVLRCRRLAIPAKSETLYHNQCRIEL